LIALGTITVGGASVKPAYRLHSGEEVRGKIPEPEPTLLEPEPIPLRIVYEDETLIVVDKPAGLVVHPAPGHSTGTLVHALLHHCHDLSGVGGVRRPGIVHRLDRGTSGLLVAAKNDRAHRHLSSQFRAHSVEREYLALVRGSPRREEGVIDQPLARHPSDRKRFTANRRLTKRGSRARRAVTRWRVEERLDELTLLRVQLETGRTHQVRVHLASIGLPVLGDPVYGGGRAVARRLGLDRQGLHAVLIAFDHPEGRRRLRFVSPLPKDLVEVLERVRS
jgi:23S rRNA pseudouridine1911/1915/1917 synthase